MKYAVTTLDKINNYYNDEFNWEDEEECDDNHTVIAKTPVKRIIRDQAVWSPSVANTVWTTKTKAIER